MCGISGFFSSNKNFKDSNKLEIAIDHLNHRGPDAKSIKYHNLEKGVLGLAHARLSIIDLSDIANQPMHDITKNFWLVFNGEIYNYQDLRSQLKRLGVKFVSNSDTEVLLYAWIQWGIKSLKRIKGMFSFAIFDIKRQKLSLVRDAFGIKPLFYSNNENGFFFSSEVNSLSSLISKKNINHQRAYDYLVYGNYDFGNETFFRDIETLQPGHIVEINIQKKEDLQPYRWWWPEINERQIGFNEASEKLRDIFLENVRYHMVSDVPIAATLSGGIDSSAIVCAMRHINPDIEINTFSYVPNAIKNEKHWIDIVNNFVGAKAHMVDFNSQEFNEFFYDVIKAQGEPFGGTSVFADFVLHKYINENGFKVVLSGQGADELFAGYQGFPQERMASFKDNKEFIKLLDFVLNWTKFSGRSGKDNLINILSIFLPNLIKEKIRFYKYSSKFSRMIDPKSLEDLNINYYSEKNTKKEKTTKGRRLANILRTSLTNYGLRHLLRHGDRNSMAWSIEDRFPFLTIDLAEFVLSLPEEYLISNRGETKSLFRDAMRGIMPKEILNRKDKVGFETPENFLLHMNTGFFSKQLFDFSLEGGFLNRDAVENFIHTRIANQDYTPPFWNVVNYLAWNKLLQK